MPAVSRVILSGSAIARSRSGDRDIRRMLEFPHQGIRGRQNRRTSGSQTGLVPHFGAWPKLILHQITRSAFRRLVPPLALAAYVAGLVPATAGPPFVTDDPEPVDFQHFEINTALQGTRARSDRSGEAPGMDINYGLLPETQFHIGLSAPYGAPDGKALQYGYGDTEFRLKYRFVAEDKDGWRAQVALYPLIDLPTGDAEHGLGAGHTRIFLPIWAQKSIGDWQTYGGGGYWYYVGYQLNF